MSSAIAFTTLVTVFPRWLRDALAEVSARKEGSLYLAGGTVRDLLLGRVPEDIDLTVEQDAKQWAQTCVQVTGGTYVPLGRNEDAARVVCRGVTLDFSSFRDGAVTIEEELQLRDMSINSLAVQLDRFLENNKAVFLNVIDPAGGLQDLVDKQIRIPFAESFVHDPLRLLRVYRFAAVLGFSLEEQTVALVTQQAHLIDKVSSERIHHELDLIMGSGRAARTFTQMASSGLLWEVLPELQGGVGMAQPASHHLDVFFHSLEALEQMELLVKQQDHGYSGYGQEFDQYLQQGGNRNLLKWAALCHDLGKPVTHALDERRDNRITFYNHDQVGARLVKQVAERHRWSKQSADQVALLVAHHMRLFHLLNVGRTGEISTKACIRLIKTVGPELLGLFLLAMADARAGKGELQPQDIETELGDLLARVLSVQKEKVQPVLEAPRLLTGNDLIKELGLTPGPLFKKILQKVQDAQMEQQITTREQALALAISCADEHAEQ